MDNQMFCFQCQETAKGTGCTIAGVCGKTAHTSGKLDLLLFLTRGISVLSTSLREHKIHVPEEVDIFVCDALFTSITNANFDEEAIISKIKTELPGESTCWTRLTSIRWRGPKCRKPNGWYGSAIKT